MSRAYSPKKIAEQIASERYYEQEQPRDVLQASLRGVRENARNTEVMRNSPDKVYKAVRSKVAGNMKSIKKSQTRKVMSQTLQDHQQTRSEGTYTSPGKKRISNKGKTVMDQITNKYSRDVIKEMS